MAVALVTGRTYGGVYVQVHRRASGPIAGKTVSLAGVFAL